MILSLLSLLIVVTYVLIMISKEGIPYSISATYYSLSHKFWFGVTMIVSAILVFIDMMEFTPDDYQFTAFLACSGMIIAGVAPNFRDEFESRIHSVGAILVLVFSQIWVGLINPVMLFLWIPYLIYSIVFTKKNWNGNLFESFYLTKPMFWIECVSLLNVYSSLIFFR